MTILARLPRALAIATLLAIAYAWLTGNDPALAATLPWTLFPLAGGLVAARVLIDWQSPLEGAGLVRGILRIGLFLLTALIVHRGYPGSLMAVGIGFLVMLALATEWRKS